MLENDTVAPSGIYARLCHAFLVGSSMITLFSQLGVLAIRAIFLPMF